jgi:dihydrofolate synthase / folylpolyglutamate synthase
MLLEDNGAGNQDALFLFGIWFLMGIGIIAIFLWRWMRERNRKTSNVQEDTGLNPDAIPTRIYDAVLDEACLEAIIQQYVLEEGLVYGWKANSKKKYDPGHWNRKILIQPKNSRHDLGPRLKFHPQVQTLWKSIEQVIGERALLHCYINAYTFGTEGYLHRDDTYHYKHPGYGKTAETIVVFLNKTWNGDYAGETVIFNEEGDIELAVLPKFNRMLVFDSSKLHVARSVSRICQDLRMVLIFKACKRRNNELFPVEEPMETLDLSEMEDPSETEDSRLMFLKEHTVAARHSGKTFYQHLKNVYDILEQNQAPEEICWAGLYHSVYGTTTYEYENPDMTRESVREQIGTYAEELVYLFCSTRRRRNRFLYNPRGLTEQQQIDLCKIEFANLLDQNTDGRNNKYLAQLSQKIAELDPEHYPQTFLFELPETEIKAPFETETELLDFLHGLEDQDASKVNQSLRRIKRILDYLENPQDRIKAIHVVGTNGKGSVCATLASVYKAAGYKTGLLISPHLVDIRERIQINGQVISPSDFLLAAQTVYCAMIQVLDDTDQITFFKFINAMAFWFFAKEGVDIAIIEAGLGGRRDSTNTMEKPLAVVVTPVALDHMEVLGETLDEIAHEKAGVFRSEVPVFSAPQVDVVTQRLTIQARELNAPFFPSDTLQLSLGGLQVEKKRAYRTISDHVTGELYQLSLLGRYQVQNITLVLKVIQGLSSQLPVSNAALQQGLQEVNWPGRFQYFPEKNLIIDGSHNSAGIESLLETLQMDFPHHKIHFGISLLLNRDVQVIEPLLRCKQTVAVDFLLTEVFDPIHRFHAPEEFDQLASDLLPTTIPVKFGTSPKQFYEKPYMENILRVVTGSLYTAGAILKEVPKSRPRTPDF